MKAGVLHRTTGRIHHRRWREKQSWRERMFEERSCTSPQTRYAGASFGYISRPTRRVIRGSTNEALSVAAAHSSLIGLAVGGKYEIRRVLGAGGMGVVCEAVHLDLGKRVAVKLIDKSMKETELIVARFRREARAAGQIKSEHIVDVFDVGADPRVGLYMVMEYLTGEDLQSRLERESPIDARTTVMIAHQVARGLVRAHAAGVIHRDLKPANIFLTERDDGVLLVKLLDFGVSKLLNDEPDSARITGSGTPIGTPLYMAPEQAEGKDDVDGRADIWSLGAVMFEALSGKPPFPDKGSYHGTIAGILTSRARALHEVATWVPAELARVVDAMLVHDPDARLESAETVAHYLLEAFPTVLPDGTGKYTAVIVPQTASSIDVTGDTEVFGPSSRPSSAPTPRPSRSLLEVAPQRPSTSLAPRSGEDSATTIPNVSGGPPTGDATPFHLLAAESEPTISQEFKAPTIAASPTTERDVTLALLAVRVERRRTMMLAGIALAVVGIAIGSFCIGRHLPKATGTNVSTAPTATHR